MLSSIFIGIEYADWSSLLIRASQSFRTYNNYYK